MKQRFTLFVFLLMLLVLTSAAWGQVKDSVPSRAHNAGFDVIIKRNGDFVYGLVQEVGPLVIRYKRTDIPDGPIYLLDRREIYAISYRNQTKEVLNPLDGAMMPRQPLPGTVYPDPNRYPDLDGYRYPEGHRYPAGDPRLWPHDPALYPPDHRNRFSLTRMSMVRLGLGFFRGFTKVKNANDYASSFTFPTLHLAYEVLLQQNLRVGVQAAFGNHKFSRQEYNDYDSLQSNTTLRERIFTLHAYGRYTVGDVYARLQPYVMGGVGLQTSFVRSDQQIKFLEQNSPVLQVKSGSRAVGIGLLVRAGAEYYLNPQIRVFADAGTGPAILQLGIGTYLQQ